MRAHTHGSRASPEYSSQATSPSASSVYLTMRTRHHLGRLDRDEWKRFTPVSEALGIGAHELKRRDECRSLLLLVAVLVGIPLICKTKLLEPTPLNEGGKPDNCVTYLGVTCAHGVNLLRAIMFLNFLALRLGPAPHIGPEVSSAKPLPRTGLGR